MNGEDSIWYATPNLLGVVPASFVILFLTGVLVGLMGIMGWMYEYNKRKMEENN